MEQPTTPTVYAVAAVDMERVYMTDSGDPEKRVSSRKRTIKSGTIVYRNGNCTMKCSILNLSEKGAMLKPADPIQVPADFRLVIDFGPSHDCEIVRKTRDQIAVRFV